MKLVSPEVAVASLAFLSVVAAIFREVLVQRKLKTIEKNAREANDAVNHRHPRGDRLYDLAVRQDQRTDELFKSVGRIEGRLEDLDRKWTVSRERDAAIQDQVDRLAGQLHRVEEAIEAELNRNHQE